MCDIFMILATLFGGGLVLYFFQERNRRKDSEKTRNLFLREISNVVMYCSDILERGQSYQSVRQSIPTPFYESHSHLLIVFDIEMSERIVKFHNLLHYLRYIDETDNKEIERLIEDKRYNGAENIRKSVSAHKHQLRTQIVKEGSDILEQYRKNRK
jgi:hypothetical protein